MMICTGFMVCFFPSALIMVFDPMPPCYKNPELHVAGYIIFWCSAFINPVIYTLSNRNYRMAFKSFVRKYLCGIEEAAPTSTW